MTTIEQARAVEQRLRENYCSCLDAYKCRGRIDPQCESCNTESERVEAADTIAALIAELKAAQCDAARYRWLRDETFNILVADHMTVYPRNTLDQAIDYEIAAAGGTK